MSRVVDWGRDKFQVMLRKNWAGYDDSEDMALKRAYEAGQDKVKYHTRGEEYEVSFNSMTQINTSSRKVRWIRHGAIKKKYNKPAKAPGGTTVKVQVAPGQQGMAATPPPKKGCCPACKCACCTLCMALPIIGLIVVAIVGNGNLGEGVEQIGEATLGALEDAEDVLGDAMGSLDVDFDSAVDAMDAASDEVAEAMGKMGEYLSEMDHF